MLSSVRLRTTSSAACSFSFSRRRACKTRSPKSCCSPKRVMLSSGNCRPRSILATVRPSGTDEVRNASQDSTGSAGNPFFMSAVSIISLRPIVSAAMSVRSPDSRWSRSLAKGSSAWSSTERFGSVPKGMSAPRARLSAAISIRGYLPMRS